MIYRINFSDVEKGTILLTQDFSSYKEGQRIFSNCQSARRIKVLEALLYPVRTHTWASFYQDLFIPATATFHAASRVKTVAGKIFLYLLLAASLAADAATLPIRMLTAIPRCVYNNRHAKELHPLYKYLVAEGVAKAKLTGPRIGLDGGYIVTEEAFKYPRAHTRTTGTVSLIPLPYAIN